MVLELAIQSIQNKLRLGSGTMLGNYEFYYAAGIICRKLDLAPPELQKPRELQTYLVSRTEGKELEDPEVMHLAKMIRYYQAEEQFDGQMEQLFQMGRSG